MSSPDRQQLEDQAREIIKREGPAGISVQLFVMLMNDVSHLKDALGEIKGTLYVLVPLTIGGIAYQILA